MSRHRSESQTLNPCIYKGQSFAYWSGRFIGLSDRLLNENDSCEIPELKDDNSNVKMQAWEETIARRVFETLEDICKTSAAKESLRVRTDYKRLLYESTER